MMLFTFAFKIQTSQQQTHRINKIKNVNNAKKSIYHSQFIFHKDQQNSKQNMLSNILYNQLSYNFARSARRLNGNLLKRYFDQKADNAYKAKDQLEVKLSIPKMSEKLFIKVFNEHNHIFRPDNEFNKQFENKVKKIRELAQKYELAKCMEACMYSNRYILFMMDEQQLESLCETVQNNYGFTNEQIAFVFTNYYRTINPKLTVMLDEKITLFSDYLHLTKEQTIQILAKNPLLIPASRLRIKQTILLLLHESKSLGKQILNKERIVNLLNSSPEIFILGRHQIKNLVNIYTEWGLEHSEVWQIILDNPIHLNNFPNEIIPIKKRLFRHFKFTKEMGRLMLRKYPLSFLSSISSLEAKLIFIKERLKLPIDANTLQLLQYKFSQIRSRGEILVRAKQPYTQQNIISYIKMSDQQFAKNLEISLDRLKEEKVKFKQTDEMDWRRRKVLKNSGVEQKLRGVVDGMRKGLYEREGERVV